MTLFLCYVNVRIKVELLGDGTIELTLLYDALLNGQYLNSFLCWD